MEDIYKYLFWLAINLIAAGLLLLMVSRIIERWFGYEITPKMIAASLAIWIILSGISK